jgi:NAD(P)-dependent dehydrogenase (short-subunit alcohol dehydrogenase family)
VPGAFDGQVALVTGAGSGIGRATALVLAERGATVVAADRDTEHAEATARRCGGNSMGVGVDVRDENSVLAMFDRTDQAFAGSLRVVANIAGIGSTDPATTTSVEQWDDVFAVNARGVFLGCKHAVPRLIANGGGAIVNMASIAGLVGLRNRAAYCASKGAVIALTRALAIDHVGDGVRVNCVCPGTVDSPWVRRLVSDVGESLDALRARQPMGRLGTPEEIAESVAYLASPAAGFVTGSALVIDGGLTAG